MRRAAAVLLAICAAPVATADVIIGNIGGGDLSSTAFGSGTTTVFKAAGFTMSNASYDLTGVTLAVNVAAPDALPRVSIWSGNTSGPVSELIVLTAPSIPLGRNDLVFTPSSQFTLDANQTYWVYVEAATSGNFNWIATQTQPSGPHATSNGYNFNGSPSSFLNKYEVSGTPVPAPSAMAMLAIGGLVAARRRR